MNSRAPVTMFRRSGSAAYRVTVCLALAVVFFLVAISGSAGLIGSAQEDANLLSGWAILVGLGGAIAARFRAAGMARAMIAAAVAQLAVPVIALAGGLAPRSTVLAPEVPISTAVFAGCG